MLNYQARPTDQTDHDPREGTASLSVPATSGPTQTHRNSLYTASPRPQDAAPAPAESSTAHARSYA